MSEIIKIDSIRALKALDGAEKILANPRPIMEMIAEELYRVARRSFETQSSPDGIPWVPLSLRYAKWKSKRFPGRGMLRLRGQLLRSLKRGVEGKNIAFVSEGPLDHANAHQYGFNGVVTVSAHTRAKTRKSLRRKANRKNPFYPVKSFSRRMHIPARPSMGFPPASERQMVECIKEMITGAANG
jgi:phage virion morphogenesis protein